MPAWLDRLMGRAPTPAQAVSLAATLEAPAVSSPHAPSRAAVFGAPSTSYAVQDLAADRKRAQANVVSVFSEASRGRTARICDLGDSVRRYDSRLDAVARMRTLAITGRPYAVKPPVGYEDDARAKMIADEISRMLSETRGFSTLRAHLASGSLKPHGVLEHRWYLNSRNLWATAPVWRHSNRFGWNAEEQIAKVDPGIDSWPGIPLSEYPRKFIVHAPVGGCSDYPWMRGALRSRIAPSLMKRFGVAWWLQLLERYGQPQLYATQRNGDTNGDSILASLRSMGVDWRAVFPEGVEPKAIPFSVNSGLHRDFVDWQNTEDAIALLGQNLSTEVKGGSYAAALSQERVRADILAADLAELDETTTDQWIEAICYFNWPGDPVPYIETSLSTRERFELADVTAGVCTVDQYREGKGQDPEADGRGDRYLSPAAPAPYAPAFAALPPAGGAAPALPFPQASPMTGTKVSASSPTSTPSTHPLRHSLSLR